MSSEITKYILATLTYYDGMDFPMTSFEIWKYLTNVSGNKNSTEYSLEAVINELDNGKIKNYTEKYRGFYFLKGRRNLVFGRLDRNKISLKKIKLARKIVKWLRWLPYVRMIAITGSVAKKNADKSSDIDFFVVLEKGKIFTGRMLVSLIVQLLGRRRYNDKIKDRICLNYYITTGSLEINLKDVFAASEYSCLMPLYGLDTFRNFIDKNKWIKKYQINTLMEKLPGKDIVFDTSLTLMIKQLGETVFKPGIIEKYLKA